MGLLVKIFEAADLRMELVTKKDVGDFFVELNDLVVSRKELIKDEIGVKKG